MHCFDVGMVSTHVYVEKDKKKHINHIDILGFRFLLAFVISLFLDGFVPIAKWIEFCNIKSWRERVKERFGS